MRQAGMKPKSHSSGTYWVRANAKNGGGSKEEITGRDKWTDGNPYNIISPKQKIIAFLFCLGSCIASIILSFIFF